MQSDTPIRPSDLQLEQQLCFMLYRNTARFIGCWDRFLRRYQLTFAEYVVLLALWEGWPASESAIAMRLQLDPYTLEDALANLERSRMLTRSTHHGVPGDRLIEPTHKGLDLRPELEEVRRRFSCELGLAPATAQALLLQLQSLSEALSGSEPMWGASSQSA
jgi:DNA-binding MarR family transcriptional regulator